MSLDKSPNLGSRRTTRLLQDKLNDRAFEISRYQDTEMPRKVRQGLSVRAKTRRALKRCVKLLLKPCNLCCPVHLRLAKAFLAISKRVSTLASWAVPVSTVERYFAEIVSLA